MRMLRFNGDGAAGRKPRRTAPPHAQGLDNDEAHESLRFLASDDEHDPDFLIVVAIDSETDHLPAPHARPLCAQAWLEACDAQERAAEAFYRDAVRQACHKLIQRYGRLQGQRQSQD
jgi:hypothetical protein